MSIIALIPRDERRLMQKAIHKTRDKNHALVFIASIPHLTHELPVLKSFL